MDMRVTFILIKKIMHALWMLGVYSLLRLIFGAGYARAGRMHVVREAGGRGMNAENEEEIAIGQMN